MHNCIMSLFRSCDEESFEALCVLLTTIGKDLDHAKAKVCVCARCISMLAHANRRLCITTALSYSSQTIIK